MAVRAKVGLNKTNFQPGKPKKTRQGSNTKYAPSSRNNARKPYRGQGR